MSTYQIFDRDNDVVENQRTTISSGLWTGGSSTLTSFFTQSSNGNITGSFLELYNEDPNVSSSAEVQFAVGYANIHGSGSTGNTTKLTTLPKETANLPILDIVGGPTFTFDAPGTTDTITPSTRNAPQESYTFTLFNADLASLAPEGETGFTDTATTTAFLNAAERKRSFTVVGKSVRLTARSLTVDTNTNLQVTGNTSGATVTLPITVKKDPSRT